MDTVRIECDNWRCVWNAGEAAKHPRLAVSCGVEGPVTVDGVWARPGPLSGAPSKRRRQHAETQRHWSMAFGPAGLWGARLEVVASDTYPVGNFDISPSRFEYQRGFYGILRSLYELQGWREVERGDVSSLLFPLTT